MALFIPDALKLLLIHDRQLVKFFPYRSDNMYYIECWLIVEDYNELNRPENAAANIKLFSKSPESTVLGILDQPWKLIFQDGERFDFSGVNAIAIENNQIAVKTKTANAKLSNSTISNAWQYNDFEFNLINLGSYTAEKQIHFITGWDFIPDAGSTPTKTGIAGYDELTEL